MSISQRMNKKVLSSTQAATLCQTLRRSGKKIVFTNGCFDVLHLGHVRYLAQARKLGDVLVVGLNSDASIRRLKGPERPINRQSDRAEVLSALEPVSFVCLFSQDTPLKLIQKVKPHVLVKGGDWKGKEVVGADWVSSYGGKLKLISFVKGRSSTAVLEKIKKL